MRTFFCASRIGVNSPYWLFWQTNTTGRFHTAARLSDSWKAPMLAAPSPKLATVTRPSPCNFEARARPLAMGRPLPTTPVVTMTPERGSEMCIGPPLPLQVPPERPRISAISSGSGAPLAISSWIPR